jgi:hypothetical protein
MHAMVRVLAGVKGIGVFGNIDANDDRVHLQPSLHNRARFAPKRLSGLDGKADEIPC